MDCPAATPLQFAVVELTPPQGRPRSSLFRVSLPGPTLVGRSRLRSVLPAPGSDTENSQKYTHTQEHPENGDEQQRPGDELSIMLGNAVHQRNEEHQQTETVQNSQDNTKDQQPTAPRTAPGTSALLRPTMHRDCLDPCALWHPTVQPSARSFPFLHGVGQLRL